MHRIFCRVKLSFSAKNENFCLDRSACGGKARSHKFGKMGNLVEMTKP